MMDQMGLENIRCFRKRQEVPLRRLTLLVGENSSGKTSFMACYQALARLLSAPLPGSPSSDNPFDAFNQPHFDFSNSIAHSDQKEFALSAAMGKTLGFEYVFNSSDQVRVMLRGPQGQAQIQKLPDVWRVEGEYEKQKFSINFPAAMMSHTILSQWLQRSIRSNQLPYRGDLTEFKRYASSCSEADEKKFQLFVQFFRQFPFDKAFMPVCAVNPCLGLKLATQHHARECYARGRFLRHN